MKIVTLFALAVIWLLSTSSKGDIFDAVGPTPILLRLKTSDGEPIPKARARVKSKELDSAKLSLDKYSAKFALAAAKERITDEFGIAVVYIGGPISRGVSTTR